MKHCHQKNIKVDKDEAIRLGMKLYWPNEKCLHGHASHRYISGNACCECSSLAQFKYQRKGSTIDIEARTKAEDLLEQIRFNKELDGY